MVRCQVHKTITNVNTKLPIIILMSLIFMIPFVMVDVSAEKIHCSENVDVKKYPICAYETQWNESERFNEKLIEELAKYTQQINEDPSRFAEIYNTVYNTVDSDNPGLKEKCDELKEWIYQQLGK